MSAKLNFNLLNFVIPSESGVEVDLVQRTDASATGVGEKSGMQKHHSCYQIQSLKENFRVDAKQIASKTSL